jgi:5,10-methylenetetrahydrofolate reductase
MGYIRAVLLLAGILQFTSCSTPSSVAQAPRFAEEEAADFIARYYSDDTSYVLKPALMEGPYRSICDRARLLTLAGQQPRRELAVIVMIHYPGANTEDAAKLAWVRDLKTLGYERIVFLRGGSRMQINGLSVLECPPASTALAGK